MNVDQILGRKGRDVATIAPDATVRDAVARLAEQGVGALVVSSDGTAVAGIISERDIVRRLATDGAAVLDRTVEGIMKREVVTCAPGSTSDELMSTMTEGRFRHVPVVDEGAMTGIVSIGDVVKVRIEELAHEKDQLESYIQGG